MELKETLKKISRQAGLSYSISREPDEYVLTEEDELIAITNAKRRQLENLIWRMKDKNCRMDQIENKIRSVNLDSLIDREEVLRIANANKLHENWKKEQQERRDNDERDKQERLIKECDYAYFYNLMKRNCLKQQDFFIENDYTLPLIKTVCFFMSRDRRIKDELGYDPGKGLMLRGVCGLGKTFLFDLIKDNPVLPVKIVSMLEIADDVRLNGYYEPKSAGILYLDDLGSERETMHYGNRINWFKDFFELFYLRHNQFNRLVVSTNLSFDELEQKYGYRFRSRAKEAFNVVNVTGEDLRG